MQADGEGGAMPTTLTDAEQAANIVYDAEMDRGAYPICPGMKPVRAPRPTAAADESPARPFVAMGLR